MPKLSPLDVELNELGWWSKWATTRLYGADSYTLRSSKLDDVFFNRAELMTCDVAPSTVGAIESEFDMLGLDSHFIVPELCEPMVKSLTDSGYVAADRMSVLELEAGRFRANPSVEVSSTARDGVEPWARVYSESFYGNDSVVAEAARVLRKALQDEDVGLFEARVEGEVAGVLATFRTSREMGVYCVGTLQKHRRRAVASTLLGHVERLAASEGRRVALQTFLSDGAEPFYVNGGFVRSYTKVLLKKELRK